MTDHKKIFLGVVQARSGSKGIPNKNIRNFCGKPLMYYTISEALKTPGVSRVIVSTDSQKYADIAKKYGAEVPFLRPAELAKDTSPDIELYLHLLDWLKKKEGYVPDYVIKLQPTSPLRTAKDIQSCIDLALSNKCDGVISLCSTEQLLYTIEKKRAKLLHREDWVYSTNRQSLPAAYKLNGAAVYIMKTKKLLEYKSFLKGNLMAYEMPKWQSPDLDHEEDFRLAELIYKNKNKLK